MLPWRHAHGPEPQELGGPDGWKRGLSAIVAVGLRPCSGAIILMVFALSQGLLWAGVAATFVMGLGTAITVATIATLAVSAKTFARRFATDEVGYGGVLVRGLLLPIARGALGRDRARDEREHGGTHDTTGDDPERDGDVDTCESL